eukprot:4972920-Ditylum_brightwellii.AAC.1
MLPANMLNVLCLAPQLFNGKDPCKSINPNDSAAHGTTVQVAILSRADKSEKLSELLLLGVH